MFEYDNLTRVVDQDVAHLSDLAPKRKKMDWRVEMGTHQGCRHLHFQCSTKDKMFRNLFKEINEN